MKPTIFAITVLTFIAALSTMSGLWSLVARISRQSTRWSRLCQYDGIERYRSAAGNHPWNCNDDSSCNHAENWKKRQFYIGFKDKSQNGKTKDWKSGHECDRTYCSLCDVYHLHAADHQRTCIFIYRWIDDQDRCDQKRFFYTGELQKTVPFSHSYKPYLVSIVYSLLAALVVAVICIVVARIVTKAKHKYDKLFEPFILSHGCCHQPWSHLVWCWPTMSQECPGR